MTKYNINECFGIRAHVTAPVNEPVASLAGFALSHTDEMLQKIPGITVTTHKVLSDDCYIDVHVIRPDGITGKIPCIIDIHGGGFVFDAAPHMYEYAARYALETGAVVIFPRYRLTPRNKYPAQINDCRNVYDWVISNEEWLKIDLDRIAIMGDSAGGYLAAMTTVYAASKGDKLAFQLLIYPVTDPTMGTKSMEEYIDTPVWNAKNNKTMWRMYFGKQNIDRESQSLLYMILPDNMPDTYIETAEFDCLHDEGIIYANKLKEAGVSVILNETKETMHGFDEIKCVITESAIKKRIEALKKFIKE